GHGAPEPLDEARVERSFPARERRGCGAVGRGERLDQLCFVELVRREREREPVAVPEGARGLVAEAGELADVVRDLGADRLRRLPRLATLRDVLALPEEPLDLRVVHLGSADDAAVA